jgi:uncharacterized SAM-binding protein YcdF (DUF218 family)
LNLGKEHRSESVDDGPEENGPANRRARSAPAPGGWFLGCLKRFALCLIGCAALLLLAYLNRESLLTSLARSWVVNEPASKADAIVVLGGNPELRPFAAARLYHQGIAPRILYMDVRHSAAQQLGLAPPERELTRRLLLSQNVPESALVAIGTNVASTYDESCAVRLWMDRTRAQSVVIPTDLFPTRRTRWIFERELNGSGRRVFIEAVAPKNYSVSNWWHHEESLISFQNEFVKDIYYHWKY